MAGLILTVDLSVVDYRVYMYCPLLWFPLMFAKSTKFFEFVDETSTFLPWGNYCLITPYFTHSFFPHILSLLLPVMPHRYAGMPSDSRRGSAHSTVSSDRGYGDRRPAPGKDVLAARPDERYSRYKFVCWFCVLWRDVTREGLRLPYGHSVFATCKRFLVFFYYVKRFRFFLW